MSKMSGREIFLLVLLVVAVGLLIWKWPEGPREGPLDSEAILSALRANGVQRTMTIEDDPNDSALVTVRSSTGGTDLNANWGDKVLWKNESTKTVHITFDSSKHLFAKTSLTLEKDTEENLDILDEAEFGKPGFTHHVQIDEVKDTPGSNIIVCPPPPLSCQ